MVSYTGYLRYRFDIGFGIVKSGRYGTFESGSKEVIREDVLSIVED